MNVILVILLFVFMFGGIPVGFAMLATNGAFLAITGERPLVLLAQRLYMGMNSFPLLAVPLFVLTGYLMEGFGISQRLIDLVRVLFGRNRGAMGTVTIVTSGLFAAMTGSAPATVAAIGSTMIPAMTESGYPKRSAAAIAAAAGTLGPIIPPSIIMIVYGSSQGVSIPAMFLGGVVPGLLIIASLVVVNSICVRRWGVQKVNTVYTMKEIGMVIWNSTGVLLLPVIILGGIYGGIFTPTEAATVSVIYVMILGLFFRKLTPKSLAVAFSRTVETSAMVIFIVAAANLFGWLISALNISVAISEFAMPLLGSQTAYLVVLTVILLIMGMLTDCLVTVVVLGPILVPLGLALGVDPLHLGVAFCVNLTIGFITPPFGLNLFTASSISKVTYNEIVKGVLPFMIVEIIDVLLITFIPQIITFLPALVYK